MSLWGKSQTRFRNWMAPITASTEVLSNESAAAFVVFPVPWTSRIQTPVKRVPAGKLWSQPDRYKPDTYGGPQ